MTEKKSLVLAGVRPSSAQLEQGLPIFYKQLIDVLLLEQKSHKNSAAIDHQGLAKAASGSDELAMVKASAHPEEAELAKTAGLHGTELLRLGYTLSHVVHAYGSMCQAITELATSKEITITTNEFQDLNRCLDIAIAGAVTEFQALRNTQVKSREVEQLGVLAHELRNALGTAKISLQLIQRGTVGIGGSTGKILEGSLNRMGKLIDSSLTEVRLRIDPEVHVEASNLLQLVDQIAVTAEIEAQAKDQVLEIKIDPNLSLEVDQQLTYSALSNLIQNAVKYTRVGGKIQVRGKVAGGHVEVEVEDECGGQSSISPDLFKPFVQKHENRTGLGIGLTIAQRAIELNQGTIEVRNLPGKGCIFKISLPKKSLLKKLRARPQIENDANPA